MSDFIRFIFAFYYSVINGIGEDMAGLLFVIAIILLYFAPGLIASRRKHNNVNAIGALNIFLGWTLIGWVAAMVWSLTDNVKAPAPLE